MPGRPTRWLPVRPLASARPPFMALFHKRQMEVPPRLCRSACIRRRHEGRCQHYDSPLLSQAQAEEEKQEEKRRKHRQNSPDHRICVMQRWLQPPTLVIPHRDLHQPSVTHLPSFITMPVALLVTMVPGHTCAHGSTVFVSFEERVSIR